MVYTRNEPVASDLLEVSQPKLAANTNGSDDSFGVDHYKFSDLTANNGFHNKVTTPAYVATPPTGLPPVTVGNPIFYAFQLTGPIGVIQYSRGVSNAVPTPLTAQQSPAAPFVLGPSNTAYVLDFAGTTVGLGVVLATGTLVSTGAHLAVFASVAWNGTTFKIVNTGGSSVFNASSSGSILELLNSSGASTIINIHWTFNVSRVI